MGRRKRSEWEIEKTKELKEEYGGYLYLEQVRRELGHNDRRSTEKWLEDVPCTPILSQRKWEAKAIAEKLYFTQINPA